MSDHPDADKHNVNYRSRTYRDHTVAVTTEFGWFCGNDRRHYYRIVALVDGLVLGSILCDTPRQVRKYQREYLRKAKAHARLLGKQDW